MSISFSKMHGLGNDFVILGLNDEKLSLTTEQIRKIADRRLGVGCDQVVVLSAPVQQGADVFMHIYNPDGSVAGACGNATRCVADVWMQKHGTDRVVIEIPSGLLRAKRTEEGLICVNMGEPALDWDQIPLSHACDTSEVDVGLKALPTGVAVNMGNPHVVFFDGWEGVDIPSMGERVEKLPLFPERVNVSFATVKGRQNIRFKIWERGTGITRACGTGACAVLVAGVRRGLVDRRALVEMDGGCLTIEWREDDNTIWMTGGVSPVFTGVFSDMFLNTKDAE